MALRHSKIGAMCCVLMLRFQSVFAAPYDETTSDLPKCPEKTFTSTVGTTTTTEYVDITSTTYFTPSETTKSGDQTLYVARHYTDNYPTHNTTTPVLTSYQAIPTSSQSNFTSNASCEEVPAVTTDVTATTAFRITRLQIASIPVRNVPGGVTPNPATTQPSSPPSPPTGGAGGQASPDNSGVNRGSGRPGTAGVASSPDVPNEGGNTPSPPPPKSGGPGAGEGVSAVGAASLPPGSNAQDDSQPDTSPLGVQNGESQADTEVPGVNTEQSAGNGPTSDAGSDSSNDPSDATSDTSTGSGGGSDGSGTGANPTTEFTGTAHQGAPTSLLATLAITLVLLSMS